MRDYGKVYSTFWSSETTSSMTDDGKMLSLYLMTCSHNTITGVFRLPDGYISEDLGWSVDRVEKAFAELFAKGFANRCETTKWVWVRKHLEWNKPENPNQRKSAAKVAFSIPDACAWKSDFMRDCGEILGIDLPPVENPSPTVEKPFPNQKQKQEQQQEQERISSSENPELSLSADPPPEKKPRKHGSPEDHKAAQWIFSRIKVVLPEAKEPNWDGWANDIRLMREQDKRTHQQICELFKFANLDSFWRTNVLSPDTLRKQWDKLSAKKLQPPPQTGLKTVTADLRGGI